jgi:hypothetical protein
MTASMADKLGLPNLAVRHHAVRYAFSIVLSVNSGIDLTGFRSLDRFQPAVQPNEQVLGYFAIGESDFKGLSTQSRLCAIEGT